MASRRLWRGNPASGMQRLAGTVSTQWPKILAAITTGAIIADFEGTNCVVKTDARCALGYRNPANHRLRARVSGREARAHPGAKRGPG